MLLILIRCKHRISVVVEVGVAGLPRIRSSAINPLEDTYKAGKIFV